MGTIDMSQVAGIKAVDAEGNELGVVSMNELTESISEQVLQTIAMRNQATTLEQPALMSAASTLAAGNDAYENELPEQTDLKWARALDASGNPILISKESLASVVGGLLPTYGISLTTSYPDLTVDSPIYINIENNKCYLISIDYPYEKQGAIVYIKSYGELVLLNNTLPTAITFEIDNSIFIIRALSGKRGMLIKYIKF